LASVDVNTDFGIIQEQIQSGFYSNAGDVKSFKNNLLKLYNSKELRATLGENGYKYMKDNLSPEKAYMTIISSVTT
jgi:glycosyltransferase involved in cell wall biosynthesis